MDVTTYLVNRSAIAKIREQSVLIERLKHDKALLEEKLTLTQHDLRLQQQVQHSLVASKTLLENSQLPHLGVGHDGVVKASPAVVSATVQMSPAEQRELETLRLKVHALESEKKDRNADFAVQTKTFQRRIKKLQQEAFVFVVDPVQKQEFWSRICRADGETITASSLESADSDERSPMHQGRLSQLLSQPAPGFASYVYHTKEVLNIPGCKLFGHPLYSGGHMNSDRFIKLKSSSTMLLPICDGDDREPLAVLQVCGKTHHFRGMGVTVTVENCLSFTQEDEYLLSGLANFCSGLLAKVMTFTEVERTRKSETVLLTLSRQIFTCLDFPKLSMLVMQSTKELLDAACAETRRLINVPDAYEDKRFNRVRSSAWDDKTKYRTKSILAMPIISSKDSLLGVIQMINKSGGTAFKAKDEEHIAMVSQLIALAMENNNLFQKTQCIGTYIRHLPLNEALLNMNTHAEEIVGVQIACIYLNDERTNELYTYHRLRKTRVDIKPSSYKNSILEEALSLKEPLIVNNVSQYTHYNPAVDTLNGIAAQQVMFVPLFQDGKNGIDDRVFIGLLQLVNRKGTTHDFDYDDSLVAIIANQVSGILMSIIERQTMHQLHEDTKVVRRHTRELNHVGIMNAVYNATMSTFSIDKGQLWLWTSDRSSMWTSKSFPVDLLGATLFNMNLVTVGKPAPTTLSSPYGFSLAVTIDSSGALRSSTYPVNMFTRGFSLCSTHDILRLPVDAHGNRHVIQVTAASQPHYESNHFDKWMGRDVVAGDWEKIKFDLHNAFSRKETLTAYYSTTHAQSLQFVNTLETVISSAAQNSIAINGTLSSKQQPMAVAMPDASIRKEIALFLWQFCSADLKIHLDKVFALFSPYDPKATGCVDPADFEYVVKAWGVHLNHHVSLLTGNVFETLAPHFIRHTHFQHEIFPTLHPTTHVITSVQLFFTPMSHDGVVVPTALMAADDDDNAVSH
ncbi:hypothetical protein B5M09_007996 [Aphanomyces astaci]|uniref:GAF domain-containing protein n=1 Tax=Aphanomyces astaci TaxID=112090 RepID=A0A3R7WLA8_APHAT|nr:hypothetical protein B5M09_007996 [Aphanomyces astaci]